MALDAERELTQWTAGIDVKRTFEIRNREHRPPGNAADIAWQIVGSWAVKAAFSLPHPLVGTK
jgi:hypothetical protein